MRRLYDLCGDRCFLLTAEGKENSGHERETLKFPICRVPSRDSSTCKASLSGLNAARRRAILTKQYPDLVTELTEAIESFGLTKKARSHLPIRKVIVSRPSKEDPDHRNVTLVYEDGQKSIIPKLSRRTILRRYSSHLSSRVLSSLQKKHT